MANGNWTELQNARALALHRLLIENRAVVGGPMPPLTTAEVEPYVRTMDEILGERLTEFATTLEIENAYGYSREPDPEEDESTKAQLSNALRDLEDARRMLEHANEMVDNRDKLLVELRVERDALRRIVDGRAAIAEAEPAFARVERTVEVRR